MVYKIQNLNEQLCYIRWNRTPNDAVCKEFMTELRDLVHNSEKGLYFISDLRKGRIVDLITIKQLSRLTEHKNWLGSVAFTINPLSNIFAGTYRNMLVTKKESNIIVPEADRAVAFLESLQEGLTIDIDWNAILDLKS
ncbi:MAG: hypothetical protein Phog2KO_42940 [Phototrophicaceae bacterium]